MRFLLYDRVLELKRGESVRGVKAISLSEDVFSEPASGARHLPETLVIEALAQVAGWLVNVTLDFQRTSLMSMVRNVEFQGRARAGDLLVLEAQVLRLDENVAVTSARAYVDAGRPVASIEEIFFVLIAVPPAQVDVEKRKFDYFSGNYQREWA